MMSAVAADETNASSSRPAARAIKPPDHRLNGPDDYMALIPITLITIATLFVLALCMPSGAQWAPPVEHAQGFLGFEWPGRAVVGGYGGVRGDGAGGRGSAGSIAYGGYHGAGGVVAGTRTWWPHAGRAEFTRKLRAALSNSPLAVVAGPSASGRSSTIARYVDSTRSADGTPLPHTLGQRIGGVFTGGTSSEYSVILWLDASGGHPALHAQLLELQAYLRIHAHPSATDLDTVLANLHAWMYKQEQRVLLIFDNNNVLAREELLQYIPRRNAHSIVVLTTPTSTSVRAPEGEQLGFRFHDPEVLLLPPLAPKSLARVYAAIAGLDSSDTKEGSAFAHAKKFTHEMFASTPALASVAAQYHKRTGRMVDLSAASGPEQVAPKLLVAVLDAVATGLPSSSELSATQLLSTFLSEVSTLLVGHNSTSGSGGVQVPKALLESLLSAWAPSLSSHAVSSAAADVVVRQLAQFGLAAERVVPLCGQRHLHVHFAPWFIEQLRQAAAHAKNGQARIGGSGASVFEFSTRVPASVWPLLREALLSRDGVSAPAYLTPLVTALGSSSAAAYSVHTPSVVAPNPQLLPPTLAPHRLFLSALAAIVHDEPASPLRDVAAPEIMQILQRAYGSGSNQEHMTCDAAWAAALGPAVGQLLASSLHTSEASTLPPSAEQSRLDVLLMQGSMQLDVLRDASAAMASFRLALRLSDAWATRGAGEEARMPNPLLLPAPQGLESKNGLSDSGLLREHAALTASSVSVSPYTAASLSLLGVAQIFQLPSDAADSSQPFQLTLDIALNYHRLALAVKRRVYANTVAAGGAAGGEEASHPACSSSLSQMAHVYALQRNLEQAKSFYSRSLTADLATQHDSIDETAHADYLRPASNAAEDMPSGVRKQGAPLATPRVFEAQGVRSRWEVVLQQLKLVRDLSLLAHQEGVLMYPSNALDLADRARQLEAGLFGADSVAVAARLMSQGHLHTVAQAAKPAAALYSQSLELHKVLLPSSTDLRLALAHFHAGKSHNSLGRGRAGKRALELSLESALVALGGEAHPRAAELLETLGDTSLALGLHDEAMGLYRRVLSLWQTLRGDGDAITQHWRTRVLNLYTLIQQAQEEKQRKQMQLQQEQQRKLQELRAAEMAADKKKRAGGGGAHRKEEL